MTIERLLLILEDKIEHHEGMVDDETEGRPEYHEGYAAACRWFLDKLEGPFLRGEMGFPPDEDADEESW
tara:strand:+ start:916 stop:1122 length:207 start_codon:yes stop_codon:yes gene_type:complete